MNSSFRPNVLLISVDGLRADHLHSYGYKQVTSKSIDSLAQESMVFLNSYANSAHTLQSHMSILSGLYPLTHQVLSQMPKRKSEESMPTILSKSHKTLAEALRDAGYQTVWFANSMDPHLNTALGLGRGFSEIFPYGLDSRTSLTAIRKSLGELNSSKAPFFVFLHTKLLHSPYVLPPPYSTRFQEKPYLGKIIGDLATFNQSLEASRAIPKAATPSRLAIESRIELPEVKFFWSLVNENDPEDLQHLKDLYDGAIYYVDELLGEIFQELKGNHQYDNTLIVLTADHGEAFFEHGFFIHSTFHDEVLHVPLLFKLPKELSFGSKAFATNAIAQSVDIAPTILEYLGIKAPPLDGRSLVPIFADAKLEVNKSSYAYGAFKGGAMSSSALRTKDWKYISYSNGKELLYNLQNDPQEKIELNNLIQLDKMRKELEKIELKSIRNFHSK